MNQKDARETPTQTPPLHIDPELQNYGVESPEEREKNLARVTDVINQIHGIPVIEPSSTLLKPEDMPGTSIPEQTLPPTQTREPTAIRTASRANGNPELSSTWAGVSSLKKTKKEKG